MHAVVQPIFETLVIFAWCLVAGVIPQLETPGPTREQVAGKAMQGVMRDLSIAVAQRSSKGYLSRFSPELREKLKPPVEEVLDSPSGHCLAVNYKLEPVQIGVHEAPYKVQLLTQQVCQTEYQDNVEYTTITIAPVAELGDSKFFTEPSTDPADMRWEIARLETEKVVVYEKSGA
jgi:hypothetical protein